MIDRIWLQPPLAIARLGPSPVPCDNYQWGPSDLTPRGSGKTTVLPAPTLDLAPDGTLSERTPDRVVFKDADGWRPVCPYFELHGSWTVDGTGHTGPLTEAVLARFGLGPADVRWRVAVGNHKAHHYTGSPGDRIDASVEVDGDDHGRHPLDGVSPPGADRPLVPPGAALPLGSVQVPRPNEALPELRLRFTPAVGAVYGPTDLPNRPAEPGEPEQYELPPDRLILNPAAVWRHFPLADTQVDPRTMPPGLFANAENETSVGLVDDVCDGTVSVSLPGGPSATARIVVSPPDFAPDRRPFVSLADGLADRVLRAQVSDPAYLADRRQTALEVRDLFERILETMANINVDVQNERVGFLLPVPDEPDGVVLGLTENGRRRHRRYVALEVLEDVLREQPDLIGRVVRAPVPDDPAPNARMPFAMRGADSYDLHLTRRQYDLLVGWARSLRDETEPGS
ncbi:hypothetical protein [Kitasatospora sp. NPDC093806]|uniref:hypothetical protein n=1 Tax=Kitasatospora sp. NPDC093806 TaxID=3155075 RepID=UPI003420329E